MPTSRRETFGSRRTSPGRGHKILAGALGLGLGLTGTGTLAASSAAAETPSIEIPANAVQNATTQNPDGTWSSYKTNSKIGLVAVTSTHEAYPGFDMTFGNKSPHYSAGFEVDYGTRVALTTVIENQGDEPLTVDRWSVVSYFDAQGLPAQAPVSVLEPGGRITYDWSYKVAYDLSTSIPGVTATFTTPGGVAERVGNRFQDTGGTGIYGYSRWVDEPMVTLTKEVNGVSATDPASAYVGSAGEEVTYTYTVTNNHPVERPDEKHYPGATIRLLSLVDDDASLDSWTPVSEERGESEIGPGQSVTWQATGRIGESPSSGSVELAYMYSTSPLRGPDGAGFQLQAGSLPAVPVHLPTVRHGWNTFPAPKGFDPLNAYLLTPAKAAVTGDFGGNLNSGMPSAPAPVTLNASTFVRPAVAVEVTTQASANQVEVPAEVFDTATVTGDVPEGATIEFDLHKVIGQRPAIERDEIVFDDTARPIHEAGSFESNEFELTEAGTYVWHAIVRDQDGNVVAEDEYGSVSETVVATQAPVVPIPAEVTTQASANQVEVPAEVFDTATVTGDVPEGATISFKLHKQGESEAVCTADNAVFESDKVVLDGPGTYVSQATTITEAGTYAWFATVHAADGEVLALDDCGAASESIVATSALVVPEQPEIEQPKIETPIVESDRPVAQPTAPAGVVDLAHTGANAARITGLAILVVALGATLVAGARRRAGRLQQ